MFDFADVTKFIFSFFLIMPIVTFIHLSGHLFCAAIFGGTGKKLTLGCGNKLFSIFKMDIKKYYFWNGHCEFDKLQADHPFKSVMVYLGGALFNLVSIFIINGLIFLDVLNNSIFWYQFIYFSFYIMFFSLFPMYFTDGSPSDGQAALLSLKKQEKDIVTDDVIIKKKEGDS